MSSDTLNDTLYVHVLVTLSILIVSSQTREIVVFLYCCKCIIFVANLDNNIQ